jgi:hypothetical protein
MKSKVSNANEIFTYEKYDHLLKKNVNKIVNKNDLYTFFGCIKEKYDRLLKKMINMYIKIINFDKPILIYFYLLRNTKIHLMNVFNFYKSINGKTSLSVLWVLKKIKILRHI